MNTSPGSLTVTDTEVTTHDLHHLDPVAHQALCEWLQAHNIDPNCVPASTTITRDVPGRRVVYQRILRDQRGKLVGPVGELVVVEDTVTGEPAPWPPAVLAHADQQPVGQPATVTIDTTDGPLEVECLLVEHPTTCPAAWHPTPGTDLGAPIPCQQPAWHDGQHQARVDGEPGPAVIRW